tara:strand:- start:493 stop:1275 length:783 start_codon:yes stop_codon:yes gene_type:complete
MLKTNIIAEIGLNHLGQYEEVTEYLDKIFESDVDGIEFQVRDNSFYSRPEKKKLQLTNSEYKKICDLIHSRNKSFGVALTDITKVDFFESIGTDFYKVIINDITNKPLVRVLCDTGKKVLISTGLSSDRDIENLADMVSQYPKVVLNHTQLSNEPSDSNLKAIEIMKRKYNMPVSFGSHCNNHNVLYMSLCFNPSDILFYVKNESEAKLEWEKLGFPYPDDEHAILLEDVKDVVNNIKLLSRAVGSGIKEKMDNKLKVNK